ncbi:unnamed protein product [Linum tenue]|uniref:Uncharacterized protein n=1 Tax=Linum tenue TaxID=586396 RepID=A0AAV0NQN8_9ROSI|nr:unnamed protein product [Linum tenue]
MQGSAGSIRRRLHLLPRQHRRVPCYLLAPAFGICRKVGSPGIRLHLWASHALPRPAGGRDGSAAVSQRRIAVAGDGEVLPGEGQLGSQV